MGALLSIQNLSIQFSNEGNKTVAVKNSSIEIKKGEMANCAHDYDFLNAIE